MKAIVARKYGSPDVLRFEEIEKPLLKEHQLLIKVHAASVNMYDWHMLTADVFLVRLEAGLLKPKNIQCGADLAGRVEAVGNAVTQFKPGDEVFGSGYGTFAEYARSRESALVLKSVHMTFQQAAAIPMAGLTALQGLRDQGQLQAGQKVLINGAGGGVGTFAVQIAKAFGAEVTAVCSTKNLEVASALGADHVIDYTRTDFTRNGQRYDLIYAANGNRSAFAYMRALRPHGICVVAGGSMRQLAQVMLFGPLISKKGGRKLGTYMANINQKDLSLMSELFETGKVKPVIDRSYPFSEIAEALRYLGKGRAKGKVVVTMDSHG
jgi:NADPH:quinone reductase-like Zn-dependent oxidoreductase